MSLRKKIFIILLLTITLYAIFGYFTQRIIIYPSYVQLERDEAKIDIRRSVKAVQRELLDLGLLTQDWAAWNDTYQFVVDRNNDYIESNLILETFTAFDLNLIYICDTEGGVVWGEIRDLETTELISINEFETKFLSAPGALIFHQATDAIVSGVILTEKGPLMIASCPIVASDFSGSIRGAMLIGRFLNDDLVAKLVEQTQVEFKIFPIGKKSFSVDLENTISKEKIHIAETKDSLTVSTLFNGIDGYPVLKLKASINREISDRGISAIKVSTILIVLAGILVLIVLILYLQKAFVGPISNIVKHTASIRRSEDLSKRLTSSRTDEIGVLAQEIDHMVEQLETVYADLETRIAHRTSELTEANESLKNEILERKQLEAQLRQSHKLEALGTLAGGIAHDFNNILGIILGNTELTIRDVPEWNPSHQNLNEVRAACLRARDIVKQILTFSRQTDQKLRPISIRPIIEESLKMLRSSIQTTIEIRQNISCDRDTVLTDPAQINQILINLCTNAVHAMHDDGGVLKVGLINKYIDWDEVLKYPDLTPGDHIILSVSDTGHGIDPQIKDRIFDPYFTTKELGKGTGMGLAVVMGIVKNHDGAITVESEPDQGATFQILLPVIEAEPETDTETVDTLPEGSESILFVDDEPSIANMGRKILEYLGYEVEPITSPTEALNLFQSNPNRFDLVITDMAMPHMNGAKLAKEILTIRPDMPIIMCTGYSESIDVESAEKIGIRAYVMKPIIMGDLANIIRKVLDEK